MLAMAERLFKESDVRLTPLLNNFAALGKYSGNFDEACLTKAAAMYKLALAIFESPLSLSHPHLITCRTNYQKPQRKLRQSPAGDFFYCR